MAASIRFTCTALPLGRKGILNKTDKGSYRIVVGGLNAYNGNGEYYTYDAARHLFLDSGILMRRVSDGYCKGELGHPKFLPGMTQNQFFQRVASIYENNVCCVHKSLELDFDNFKDRSGRPFIAIISDLIPSGPHGPALEKSLETEGENVAFSIRTFAQNRPGPGRVDKVIEEIVTFDQVTEPGIQGANLFASPAMESYQHVFTRNDIVDAMNDTFLGIAAESNAQHHRVGQSLLKAMGYEPTANVPAWKGW